MMTRLVFQHSYDYYYYEFLKNLLASALKKVSRLAFHKLQVNPDHPYRPEIQLFLAPNNCKGTVSNLELETLLLYML